MQRSGTPAVLRENYITFPVYSMTSTFVTQKEKFTWSPRYDLFNNGQSNGNLPEELATTTYKPWLYVLAGCVENDPQRHSNVLGQVHATTTKTINSSCFKENLIKLSSTCARGKARPLLLQAMRRSNGNSQARVKTSPALRASVAKRYSAIARRKAMHSLVQNKNKQQWLGTSAKTTPHIKLVGPLMERRCYCYAHTKTTKIKISVKCHKHVYSSQNYRDLIVQLQQTRLHNTHVIQLGTTAKSETTVSRRAIH